MNADATTTANGDRANRVVGSVRVSTFPDFATSYLSTRLNTTIMSSIPLHPPYNPRPLPSKYAELQRLSRPRPASLCSLGKNASSWSSVRALRAYPLPSASPCKFPIPIARAQTGSNKASAQLAHVRFERHVYRTIFRNRKDEEMWNCEENVTRNIVWEDRKPRCAHIFISRACARADNAHIDPYHLVYHSWRHYLSVIPSLFFLQGRRNAWSTGI